MHKGGNEPLASGPGIGDKLLGQGLGHVHISADNGDFRHFFGQSFDGVNARISPARLGPFHSLWRLQRRGRPGCAENGHRRPFG